MTYRQDVVRGRDIIARWCDLAERRLEYLTELFETGRWRRFHSEVAFLENIREAKAAVETWRDLLTREASRDNYALDVSWLGRGKPTLPIAAKSRRVRSVHPAPAPAPAAAATEWPQSVTAAVNETIRVSPRVSTAKIAAAPAIDLAAFERELSSIFRSDPEPVAEEPYELPLDVSELPLDVSSIQHRYPLLRNAL